MENDLNIDNKKEKVPFLNKVVNTTNLRTKSSSGNSKLFLNSEKQFNERDRREQGNEHGAVRHTLWQAALSSWFFDDVAKDAGDAHETRPYTDTNKRIYKNLNDADVVVDLLNNKIGREIGNRNRFTGLKKLALNVLEEFKRNGLYVADDIDGVYVVSRRTLAKEKYEKLRGLFESMDNWGFQPGEVRTRDNYAPIRFIWEKIKEVF